MFIQRGVTILGLNIPIRLQDFAGKPNLLNYTVNLSDRYSQIKSSHLGKKLMISKVDALAANVIYIIKSITNPDM